MIGDAVVDLVLRREPVREAAGGTLVLEADAQADAGLDPVLAAGVELRRAVAGVIHLGGDEPAPAEHLEREAAAHLGRERLGGLAKRGARSADVEHGGADAGAREARAPSRRRRSRRRPRSSPRRSAAAP